MRIINFIIAKNNEIKEVNGQLTEDLNVCQRHLDNLARVTRGLEGEIGTLHTTSIKAIAKLREPFTSRGNSEATQPSGYSEKWANASRATHF